MTDLSQIWQDTLSQLRHQMAQATYDAHLASTRLVGLTDSQATIATPSAPTLEWLTGRLRNTISRALASVLGRAVEIEFVVEVEEPVEVEAGPATQDRPDEPVSLGSQIARGDYYAAHFEAGGSGYSMLSHYDNTFWMPYLGKAWPLWQRLANEKRAPVKRPQDRWTDPQRYSYRELAGWLNLSHTRYISGYIWECHRSRLCIRETDAALPECCRRHFPMAVHYDRSKRPRCVHWKTGLLETLHAEHLVAIEETKAVDTKIRSHVLKIQAWRLLPILTPAQVAGLNPDLQKLHSRWVSDFGHLLGLRDVAHWEEIAELRLIPLMDGYREFQKLDGPYRPNSRFLRLMSRKRPAGFETIATHESQLTGGE